MLKRWMHRTETWYVYVWLEGTGTGLFRICILNKYGVLVLHQSYFIVNCCSHTKMVKLYLLKFSAAHDDEIDLNHFISLHFISFIILYFMFHDFCFFYRCDWLFSIANWQGIVKGIYWGLTQSWLTHDTDFDNVYSKIYFMTCTCVLIPAIPAFCL